MLFNWVRSLIIGVLNLVKVKDTKISYQGDLCYTMENHSMFFNIEWSMLKNAMFLPYEISFNSFNLITCPLIVKSYPFSH